MQIEELNFSVRTYNCLKRERIDTVEQLSKLFDRDLMKIHAFGAKCLAEVRAVIEQPKESNADRIRAMSYEEKAREFVFFCPTDAVFRGEDTYGKPHYTGFDGKYYSTSEEVIDANLKWLKQPAEESK